MEIHQEEQLGKGTFIAREKTEWAGEMTYVWAGADKIIIDHTDVNPSFSGKGVGKALLMAVVAFAREKQIKILPLCPFAYSMFAKTAEIRDVLV